MRKICKFLGWFFLGLEKKIRNETKNKSWLPLWLGGGVGLIFSLSCNPQPAQPITLVSHGQAVTVSVFDTVLTAQYLGIKLQQNEGQATTTGHPLWLINGDSVWVFPSLSEYQMNGYKLRSAFTYPDSAGLFVTQ